jgi:sulfur carrier protein
VNVVVNGVTRQFREGATTADAVRVLTTAGSGVAVAVNGEVVTRSAWDSTVLGEGDQVEVLTAVQGG